MFKEENKLTILPYIVFFLLTTPFVGSIPYLDGNIDFIKTVDFYEGGLKQLFQNWISVHPPFRVALTYPFYKIFGVNSFSFILPGIILGLASIYYTKKLSENLFGNKVALISSMLLATSPLFIASGIFSLIDYLLAVLIIISLYHYYERQYFQYSIFASLTVLTKETSLVFVFCVPTVDIFLNILERRHNNLFKSFFKKGALLLPLLTSYMWFQFVKLQGQKPWADWNFSSVADKGSFYTIFHNLLTLELVNKYAIQNWLMIIFLNFMWINWAIILVAVVVYILKGRPKVFISRDFLFSAKGKVLLVSTLFIIGYSTTVLSFQTYTIPRYGLPIVPLVLTGTAWGIVKITETYPRSKSLVYFFVSFTIFLSLFFSADPISTGLWKKTSILGEEVYALNKSLSGNDGITYNGQYLSIIKRRTRIIMGLEKSQVSGPLVDCWWLFPNTVNDIKTMEILSLRKTLYKHCGVIN